MSWVKHTNIDFADESIIAYHIDTRDFHVSTNNYLPPIDLFKTRKNPDQYFFTPEEIKELIERYYNQSGGDGEWRMFSLEGSGRQKTEGWQLKYIRIHRLKHRMYKGKQALVIYDERSKFLFTKDILNNSVNQEFLNHH